jgi:Protein of unknown function (DUF3108)
MAAWLKPFLLALLAALCLHIVSIAGIGSQMQSASSVLAQRIDPLFTRSISAASTPQAAAQKAAKETASPQAATSVASMIEAKPAKATVSLAPPTPTVAEIPTETVTTKASADLAVIPTAVAAATPSTLSEPIATAAITNSPTQNITGQPISSTESLLVTGEWPSDTRVIYQIGGKWGNDLFGKGIVQWTRSGNTQEKYQVKVVIDIPSLPTVSMTSQGRVSSQGLLPEAYEEVVASRIRNLRLDPTEIAFDKGNRIARPAIAPMSVQDTVSQFIDIGYRYQQGREQLQAGQSTRVWLARPGNLYEWIYDIAPAQDLSLPKIGSVKVHHLKPRPQANPRGTYSMEMWLAPSLQYLPVRIRMNINAESYIDLFATEIQQK